MKLLIFLVVLLQVLTGTIGVAQRAVLFRHNHFRSSELCAHRQRELKFPRECGYTPFHSRPHIFRGNVVQPDEYSWMASLQYKNPNMTCSGSVINSRYVLTAGHCVIGDEVERAGEGLTGVRLGEFYRNGTIKCDYGSQNCMHYQLFGIEDIKVHEEFSRDFVTINNDIALIRVNRMIQLGFIRPICVPGGNVDIREPDANTIMTVAGWGTTWEPIEIKAKRDAQITLWDTDRCNKDSRKLCAVGSVSAACEGDSGGPLMYHFAQYNMVIEGIVSYGSFSNCSNTKFPGIFTRVRSYIDWLESNMHM